MTSMKNPNWVGGKGRAKYARIHGLAPRAMLPNGVSWSTAGHEASTSSTPICLSLGRRFPVQAGARGRTLVRRIHDSVHRGPALGLRKQRFSQVPG